MSNVYLGMPREEWHKEYLIQDYSSFIKGAKPFIKKALKAILSVAIIYSKMKSLNPVASDVAVLLGPKCIDYSVETSTDLSIRSVRPIVESKFSIKNFFYNLFN